MTPILSMQVWLSLPMEVRNVIRKDLGIKRSGHVEVFDGMVLCDGTMMEDLQELTTEKMQSYLHSTQTDFYKLFNELVTSITTPPDELSIEVLPKEEAIKEKRKYEKRKKGKQK